LKIPDALLKRIITACYILIISLIIFSGCAKKESIKNQTDDEGVLRQRGMEYWNYKTSKEEGLEKMYPYEDLYSRKKISLVKYIQMHANQSVVYSGYQIEDIAKIDADSASVRMKVKIRIKVAGSKPPLEGEREMTDKWLRMDGEWYHVLRETNSLNQKN